MPTKKTAATKKTPAALAPPAAGVVELIPENRLEASPLNPRKTVDAAALAELADSVASQGVLQNLIARPHPANEESGGTAGKFEIAAGARRHAAVRIAVADGRLPSGYALPVVVRELDDKQLLEIATIENMARQDMDPLDEAEAILALRDVAGLSIPDIATRTGIPKRTVDRRMAIATKVADKVKTAYRAGDLNVAQLRAFANGPSDPARQEEVLDEIADMDEDHWGRRAEAIERRFGHDLPPVRHAIFEAEKYDGEILYLDSAAKFADADQFMRLQKAAVVAKVEELEKTLAWVEVLRDTNYLPYDSYDRTTDKNFAGAVITMSMHGEVKIHDGLLSAKETAARRREAKARERAAANGGAAGDVLTKAHIRKAHGEKTFALQVAIAEDPKAGLVVTILGMLKTGAITLTTSAAWHLNSEDEMAFVYEAKDALTLCPALDTLPRDVQQLIYDHADLADHWDESGESEKEQAAIARALYALPLEDLARINAILAARHAGDWNGWADPLGSEPLAIALAECTGAGARIEGHPWLRDGWLDNYRKPTLAKAAIGAGINAETVARLARKPKAKFVEAIFADLERDPTWIPPELRFIPSAEVAAFYAEAPAEPETPAEAPAEAAE